MGKANEYYLIARDRGSNNFSVLSIGRKKALSLEEIDLYTTYFENEEDLAKGLREKGVFDYTNPDLFIVNQSVVDGEKVLKTQELLYAHDKRIQKVADASLQKKMDESKDQVDSILDQFAERMRCDSLFYSSTIAGMTNVYDKYVKYFIFSRYQMDGCIKYRDGAWARKSYPLVRNVLEACSRSSKRYSRLSDEMHRHLLEKEILRVTDPQYDENQLTILEMFPEEFEENQTDQLLEVVNTFENLPRDTFIADGSETQFNSSVFSQYKEGDLEKLRTYLPNELRFQLQLFTIYRDYLEHEPEKFGGVYRFPIQRGQKDIIELLSSEPETLKKAYAWCQLYESYKEKMIGDVHGREYQKRRES